MSLSLLYCRTTYVTIVEQHVTIVEQHVTIVEQHVTIAEELSNNTIDDYCRTTWTKMKNCRIT